MSASLDGAFKRGLARLSEWRDSRGTVAVLFALSIAPMTFLVGAAVDYSGASNLKAHLQRATDAAGLQLCQVSGNPTESQLLVEANKMLPGYLGTTAYTVESLTLSNNPRSVDITTKAMFPTAIVKAFGTRFAQVPVEAHARCFGEPQTFEIALVLDNTGSMSASAGAQTKIEALKSAATSFVNSVYSSSVMATGTKISIVPFAAAVAVNPSTYRNASWIDQAGNATHHWNFVQGGTTAARAVGATNRFVAFDQLKTAHFSWDWAGCLESLTYPLNVRDGTPTPSDPNSYFVPMLAPDESGAGGELAHKDAAGNYVISTNSYIDDQSGSGSCPATTDENARFGRPCKYVEIRNARTSNGAYTTGPNASCTTRPLTRLTSNTATLLSEISQMQPNGNTDIHEGFMWGWRTVSPSSVFASDAAAYNKANNNKVIVLMTDGDNTWTSNPTSPSAKSLYSAYGYFRNGDGIGPNSRLPPANANPTSDAHARAAMDALTLEGCRNAATSPSNVVVYTVGFSATGSPISQQSIDMLRTCAGSADRAYVANDSTALQAVFKKIAADIGALRLTN
ncbi:pilus assembly protein TadG-related protein [uncultured Enterovirga sp.]|uniref:TadE/TadG family type IV pilus assembly protein n=1 Tax=uncultured Enterovirga sp. TaxID=2026352 RepID=UPI0035C98F92